MRFEAKRVDLGAAVLVSLIVISCIGEGACDLSRIDVSWASGAHDSDVERDSARFSEVVDDDIARASVVSCDQACHLMLNEDTRGAEDAGEGVDDVVVALMSETRLFAGGLMDAVLVVRLTAVTASGRADDVAESELDDAFEGVRRNFRTEVLIGDRKEDGARNETGRRRLERRQT